MRDALLAIIVVGLVVAGIRSSVAAILCYLWFALMRPDILAWATQRPYSLILGIIALVSALRDLPWLGLAMRSIWTWLFIGLGVWYGLSVLTSRDIWSSWGAFRFFLPTLSTSLLIPVVIRTRESFRRMMMVIVFSLGVLGIKFGLWGLLQGGAKFVSGYGGSISDNNIFGLAMVTVLPLCWYLRDVAIDWRIRWAMIGLSFFILAAAIQTHSRGTVLALAFTTPMMIWRSRRRLAAAMLLLLVVAPTLYLVKDSLLERMGTLNVDGENELDASARLRLQFWRAAVKMSLDYPITGVGFGATPFANLLPTYMTGERSMHMYAHNNYLQILADSGFPALIIFCLLLFGQIFTLGRLYSQLKRRDPELAAYAAALQTSLVGFAFGSIFLSRTYYEFIYYLFMVVTAFGFLAQSSLVAPVRTQTVATPVPAVPRNWGLNRTPRPRPVP